MRIVREHTNNDTDYGAMCWKTTYYIAPDGREYRDGFAGHWRNRPDAQLMPMWGRERLSQQHLRAMLDPDGSWKE